MNPRPAVLGSAVCFGVAITLAACALDPAVDDLYLTPKEYALLLASAGAVVVWTVGARKATGGSLRFTAIEAILAASLLWGVIVTPHWLATREGNWFWQSLAALLITVVVRQLFNPPSDDDARGEPRVRTIALADLMVAIWVVGSALAVHGLAKALVAGSFQPADGSAKTTVTSIIGGPNAFGALMAAGIIATVTLASQTRRRLVGLLLAGGGLLQLAALLGNRSRGAMLGLFAAGLLFLLIRNRRWLGRRAGVAVLGALVLVVVAGFQLHRLNPPSSRARLMAWQISGAMLSDRPLTGVGAGRFSQAYGGYQAELWRHPDYAQFDHQAMDRRDPLSEPIHQLAEQGLPGGALYVLLWACALGFLLRALVRGAGTSPLDRGLLALLVAILVHSLVDHAMHWVATLMIAHLGFGLIPGPVMFRVDLRRARVRKLATGVAVAWTAAVAVKTGWEYPGYQLWTEASRAAGKERLELLKRAHRRLPSEPRVSRALGVELLEAGHPEEAVVVLQRGLEEGDGAPLRLALAEAQLEIGWIEQAELNGRISAARYPDLLRPRLTLARIHHAKGEDAQARSALASCIRRDTYYRSALVNSVVQEATLLWRKWYDDEPPR